MKTVTRSHQAHQLMVEFREEDVYGASRSVKGSEWKKSISGKEGGLV